MNDNIALWIFLRVTNLLVNITTHTLLFTLFFAAVVFFIPRKRIDLQSTVLKTGFVILFVLTILSPFHVPSWVPPVTVELTTVPVQTTTATANSESISISGIIESDIVYAIFFFIDTLLSLAAISIVLSVLIGIPVFCFQYYRLLKLRTKSHPVLESHVKRQLQEVLKKTELKGPIGLRCSNDVPMAITMGLFRPTILLNKNYRSWSENHVQAVLAHEICHIKRYDYFFSILSAFCFWILFLNPFMVWFRRKLNKTQEKLADRQASALFQDTTTYSCVLAELSLQKETGIKHFIAPAFVVRDVPFIERVKDVNEPKKLATSRLATAILCLLVIICGSMISGLRLPSYSLYKDPETNQWIPKSNYELSTTKASVG